MALGQHIILRLADNRVIAPAPEQRRVVARVVLEIGRRFDLLCFGLADTHQHLLTPRSRAAAGEFARRVEISLGQRLSLDVGFTPAYFKGIEDGRHLNRAFRYILEQSSHHGLEWDPLLEASNWPDLLGLRTIGAYTATNVRRYLPRIKRGDLLACAGLDELAPADGPPERLVLAASAATALPDLRGKSPAAMAAKQALIQAARGRLRTAELAGLVALSERRVQVLRGRPENAELVRAVQLQLGLIQRRAEGGPSPEMSFVGGGRAGPRPARSGAAMASRQAGPAVV